MRKGLREILLFFCVMSYFFLLLKPCFANNPFDNSHTSLNLRSCIKLGLEKNPRIKAIEYEVKKAEADLMAAKSDFFPQVSLSVFRERIDSIRASGPTDSDYEDQFVDGFDLRISQILFAGLSVVNSYKRAELYKELVLLQKEQTTSQLILQIVTTYFELAKAKKDVENYKEAVKNLELNLKYANALYEKKLITRTDVLNSEVDLANMKTRLSQAMAQVSIYRDNLKTLIGLNPDMNISFLDPEDEFLGEFIMSLDDCVKSAQLSRQEIKIAQKRLEIAKKEKNIIGAKLIPSVNLTVDYYKRGTSYDEMGMSYLGPYDRDQKNTYWIGQINVYWSLGRGGRSIFEAKKAIYEIERLKKDIEDIKDQVTTQVRNYYLSVKEAKERILFTKKALLWPRKITIRRSRGLSSWLAV